MKKIRPLPASGRRVAAEGWRSTIGREGCPEELSFLENKIRLIKDSPGFLCPPSPALGWYMSCTHVCATVRHKTGIWHLDSLIPHVPWPFSRNPTPSPLTFGGLQNRPRPPKGILPFRSTTAQTCLVSVPQHDEPRFPMELVIYRATVAGPQKTRV